MSKKKKMNKENNEQVVVQVMNKTNSLIKANKEYEERGELEQFYSSTEFYEICLEAIDMCRSITDWQSDLDNKNNNLELYSYYRSLLVYLLDFLKTTYGIVEYYGNEMIYNTRPNSIEGMEEGYNKIRDLKDEFFLVHRIIQKTRAEFYDYNSLSVAKRLEHEKIISRLGEDQRPGMLQCLAYLAYILNKKQELVEYANEGLKLSSGTASHFLIEYYCDNSFFNEAYDIFVECMSIPWRNSSNKSLANRWYSNELISEFILRAFYKNGFYEECLHIIEKTRVNLLSSKHDYIPIPAKRDIRQFLAQREKDIISILKDKSDNKARDIIEEYFELNIVELMTEDVQTYIKTAIEVYSFLNQTEKGYDFSPAVIPLMKAVENVLFKIIADDFHKYVASNNYSDKELPDPFISKRTGKFLKTMNYLTMEDALECIAVGVPVGRIGNKNAEMLYTPNSVFLDYCETKKVTDSYDTIVDFAKTLDVVKSKRNQASHRNRFYKIDAEESWDYLLTGFKFIAFLLRNFSFVFQQA